MTALIIAVFVASLLGSLHCAGMCGAFAAFAVAPVDGPGPSRAALNGAYNLGRLFTYSVLGAIAGLLGAALDLGGSLAGVSHAAAIGAGGLMVGFGGVAILRAAGVRIPRAPVPEALRRMTVSGHRATFGWPPLARATAVGLLTTLLPCGWLYAFVITAAGAGHPATGALTMAVFWAGTLPVMVGVGVGLQALTGVLRPHLPVAVPVLLIVVGVATVIGRLGSPAFATPTAVGTVPHDFGADRVRSLDAGESPCCNP
jgi:sulfite exporter TauE/SafE